MRHLHLAVDNLVYCLDKPRQWPSQDGLPGGGALARVALVEMAVWSSAFGVCKLTLSLALGSVRQLRRLSSRRRALRGESPARRCRR